MSSTSVFSSATASSSSPAASTSQSQSSGGSDPNQANTFYKNLFYILIGLLCAFGLVSFISLMRARRRRRTVVREAERLGLIVPGMDDYIPFREREDMKKRKNFGTSLPNWWEVASSTWSRADGGTADKVDNFSYSSHAARDLSTTTAAASGGSGNTLLSGLPHDLDEARDFRPLAVLAPPREEPKPEDKPISTVPFFPNHLAYRPESLIPLQPMFPSEDPEAVRRLAGKNVRVAVLLKMPTLRKSSEVEENEEVLREWEGVQLGIASVRLDQ